MNRVEQISWTDFSKIDIRVGTVITAKPSIRASKPAFLLTIDFGEAGIKKSSAQITDYYNIEKLIGSQVIAVINFPSKQIADFMSECLVLGAYDRDGQVVLIGPRTPVDNGSKIG